MVSTCRVSVGLYSETGAGCWPHVKDDPGGDLGNSGMTYLGPIIGVMVNARIFAGGVIGAGFLSVAFILVVGLDSLSLEEKRQHSSF